MYTVEESESEISESNVELTNDVWRVNELCREKRKHSVRVQMGRCCRCRSNDDMDAVELSWAY